MGDRPEAFCFIARTWGGVKAFTKSLFEMLVSFWSAAAVESAMEPLFTQPESASRFTIQKSNNSLTIMIFFFMGPPPSRCLTCKLRNCAVLVTLQTLYQIIVLIIFFVNVLVNFSKCKSLQSVGTSGKKLIAVEKIWNILPSNYEI